MINNYFKTAVHSPSAHSPYSDSDIDEASEQRAVSGRSDSDCNEPWCEAVDDVALEMECQLAANPIVKEKLRKIPNTNTYANSLNVFVGRQRSGKSYQAIQ